MTLARADLDNLERLLAESPFPLPWKPDIDEGEWTGKFYHPDRASDGRSWSCYGDDPVEGVHGAELIAAAVNAAPALIADCRAMFAEIERLTEIADRAQVLLDTWGSGAGFLATVEAAGSLGEALGHTRATQDGEGARAARAAAVAEVVDGAALLDRDCGEDDEDPGL